MSSTPSNRIENLLSEANREVRTARTIYRTFVGDHEAESAYEDAIVAIERLRQLNEKHREQGLML